MMHFNLDALWYQDKTFLWPLLPITALYKWIVKVRRKLYDIKNCEQRSCAVPVIVVGNITVGGTGKTPLVIYIVEFLRKHGWHVGIISRGYQGSHRKPESVYSESDPKLVGDEAVMLAKHLSCPIVVAKNRKLALEKILAENKINIVVSDDGLQHYGLPRDVEIAVIDGQRRFGNGKCLPVGPLREPKERLKKVDLIVNNGGIPEKNEYDMQYDPQELYNALHQEHRCTLESLSGKKVHAIAGIGNPNRFFQLLKQHGIEIVPHVYPDHYLFYPKDIYFNDELPVLMTEKDVVKCLSFVDNRHWALPIKVKMTPIFDDTLLNLIEGL